LGRKIGEDQVFASLSASGELADLMNEALDRDNADPLIQNDRSVISVSDARVRSGESVRRSDASVRDLENLKALVGQVGEFYVYHWLKRLGLESFDQECWISSNRTAFLGCEDGDDAAGFDFKIIDTEGKLSGRRDAPIMLLEVKSKFGPDDGRFFITAGEWETAMEASRNPNEEYWIIVVEGVGDSPRITQFIKDPYQLSVERKVVFEHRVLSMRVAT